MSSILCKYSDGESFYPLTLIDQSDRLVSRFYGDPFISTLSNLMVKSINGNATLKNSRVICLSDFHYDTVQKYIRARIINEVLHFRNTTYKDVILLLEGTQAGYEPDEWVYNKLVGINLIYFDHIVAGWDNMKLNVSGIKLIKKMQNLRSDSKEMEREYTILNRKRSEILRDMSISPEEIFERVDIIEAKMKSLLLKADKISATINFMRVKITELAHERNKYLHKSINRVLKKYPESIIFVVGGEEHFKDISRVISNVSHCILNIQEVRVVIDFDEAIKEVYGNASSKLLITCK